MADPEVTRLPHVQVQNDIYIAITNSEINGSTSILKISLPHTVSTSLANANVSAYLTTVNHFSLASLREICTNYKCFKTFLPETKQRPKHSSTLRPDCVHCIGCYSV